MFLHAVSEKRPDSVGVIPIIVVIFLLLHIKIGHIVTAKPRNVQHIIEPSTLLEEEENTQMYFCKKIVYFQKDR